MEYDALQHKDMSCIEIANEGLMERNHEHSNNIDLYRAKCNTANITVVFISLYSDFLSDYRNLANIELKKKKKHLIAIEEKKLFKNRDLIEIAIQSSANLIFSFDSAKSLEAMSLVARLLSLGHEVYVFAEWTYKGQERRKAISLLLRQCFDFLGPISSSEYVMWKVMIEDKLTRMNISENLVYL
jgi:hypothetical protein